MSKNSFSHFAVPGTTSQTMDGWLFDADYAARILHEQFGTATLDGFGLAGKSAAIGASGAMIHYVRQTQKTSLGHITGLSFSENADYLVLDAATIRNLELFEPSSPPILPIASSGGAKDSLLGVVNMVLFTALSTLGAFIYNVCADLVGGIEVTLSEKD